MIALVRRFLAPYQLLLVVVVTLLLVQAVANLLLPNLNADIINNGVVTGNTSYILRTGGVMLAATLGLGLASIIAVFYSARVAMGFGRDLRGSIFRSVEKFSLREVNLFGAPSLITRSTNDVQQVQLFVVTALTMMVSAPITMVGGIIMAIHEDAKLSLLLTIILPVLLIVVGSMIRISVPLFRLMQERIDRINLVLREHLEGIRVIRAFVRTDAERVRFAAANKDLTDTTLRVNRIFALLLPTVLLIMNTSSVAIIYFGAHRVNSGGMPIGNMTAFLTYLMQILWAVMMAVMTIVMIPRAAASAERIGAVLAVAPDITDPVEPRTPETRTGLVELIDVSYSYPGAAQPVVSNVTVTFPPGRTTAVVGSTGSGKSTLVNLIPRLFDASSGQVRIDGVDVRDMSLDDVWSRIGLVPQRAFLFTGSVASNVRFGAPNADDTTVWSALEVAQASDFVLAMPDGIDTVIDQGGANVSGGQRQRLAIARALVRDPEIYIFDDAFSALDVATDQRLRAALATRTAHATVIIVAQRISTIRSADSIVVLDEGHVVGQGTHEQLLETCPTYQEIVASQLSAEEAA